VAYVELDLSKNEIAELEKQVILLADSSIKDWNGTRRRVSTFAEPTTLVDALLDDLGWTASQRAALNRQSDRYTCLIVN
jgi:hypothetical protein